MTLHPDILDVLRGIVDPEVGINIVDLGLVYRAERTNDAIDVAMTMTTRACPLGEMMLEEARAVLAEHFPDVQQITANLVWEPPWTPAMMTPQGQEQLAT